MVIAGLTPREAERAEAARLSAAGCPAANSDARELFRVARSPEGERSLDFKGKAPGRGAYLCGKPECLKKARKSRAIARALSVEVPESVYDQLEQQMEQEGANGN